MSYTNEEYMALCQYLESISIFTIQPTVTKPIDEGKSLSPSFSTINSSFHNIKLDANRLLLTGPTLVTLRQKSVTQDNLNQILTQL